MTFARLPSRSRAFPVLRGLYSLVILRSPKAKGAFCLNTTQIKCFLALADTLNFTKAAAQLYLSQPALSRQIVSLEQELNTLLFIRDQKSVRLTPAGALLAGELGGIQQSLSSLILRVQTVGMGYTGSLTIGVLEGQWMGVRFTDLCRQFMAAYPNIDLNICPGSFGTLRRQLNAGEIDIAITLEFDVTGLEGVLYRRLGPDRAVFAVSRQLPLAKKEVITFPDMLTETLLIISPEDSLAGADLLLSYLAKTGLSARSTRYAPNLSTLMLWIEAGLGVGIINHQSSLAQNPSIRLINEVPLEDASTCTAWRKENLNPAIALFGELLSRQDQ